jgi:hypothetical protein
MSIIQKLKNLNLKNNPPITLVYESGTDVFVHNETEIETALSETETVSEFCDLVASLGSSAMDGYGNYIIPAMREEGYLEDYDRDHTFSEYLTETLTENFYDQQFIESSVERYDHKRGFCTLEATVKVPLNEFIEKSPFVSGWTVSVPTDNGTLTFD